MTKMIFRTLEIKPFGTNCYLVASENTRDTMVIDPAGEARKILSNINELNLRVGLIVLTHTHPDHIGAVKFLKESIAAALAVHAAEAGFTGQDYSAQSGSPVKKPPVPDRILQDGDELNVGDLVFKVLHTPGHTPGGICLAGYGVVFSGDTLFNMSIGRTDGPGGDYNQLISSIKNKLLVLPDQTVVLPGHGPKTIIGNERSSNPFLR